MNKSALLAACTIALGLLSSAAAEAASPATFTENFTGTATNNPWYFVKGACLTAGSTAIGATTSPGQVPSCASMTTGTNYYNIGYQFGIPLVGGSSGTIPGSDAINGGALRLTNADPPASAYPQGYFESGAILSNFSFPLAASGIQITFVTETYIGNSGGSGGDGADGISFFLQDASQTPDLGATGGSLAYSCSNTNNDPTLHLTGGQPRGYDGLTGGYIGLGIDEYGNFLNAGDNTATGYGYQWNRIGLRGAGTVAWAWLNANYAAYYPSTLTNGQKAAAVQATCKSGVVMNYTDPLSSSYGSQVTLSGSTIPVLDYTALSYHLLNTLQPGIKIANESAIKRGNGTLAQSSASYGVPISYNLKITTGGLLSLSYSYNGGASVGVITGQNITASNGALPANVRFGFAASDGGSTNIHEIMCFQAAPQTTSASSAAGNQKQAAPVVQGTQVYFSYYDPNSWSGSVTSESILVDASNNVFLNPVANWDASCVLTGVLAGNTCQKTTVPGPILAEEQNGGRTMLTWSGTAGIPFRWGSLTSAEQTVLDTGDSTTTSNRLDYLRGVRGGEQNSSGTSSISGVAYRARASVLGDIVDSSPTWVGPPSSPYPDSWIDSLRGGTQTENSGQVYSAFANTMQSRINVVYAGADDGFLHGFRSGYYVGGVYQGTGSGASFVGTQNDGQELLAYMPGYTLNHIQTSSSAYNYSDVQYAHQFDVDATPGTGDLYYNGAWHTWLVGGLGTGGSGIYALDVSNPANNSYSTDPVFAESNAGTLVVGDWTNSTLTCTHVTSHTSTTAANCGQNLGNTYGTPQIRRLHNGGWAAIFGNGFGSASGDAGIFIMMVSASGAPTFEYISTGTSGQSNGIAYISSADLDGDRIVDYVYAGDLLGNIWRFDLTATTATTWDVTSNSGGTPQALINVGQPITSKVAVLSFLSPPNQRLMIEFGTGQQTPLTPAAAASYLQTQQYLYGVWDWNMATWNSLSATQYAQLPYQSFTAPSSITTSNMQSQSMSTTTISGLDYRSVTANTVCWPGLTGCSSGTQYGWYLPLTSGHANPADVNLPNSSGTTPMVYEQVIFNPVIDGDTFFVNTIIPSAASLTNCFSASAGGYTMAINPATGGSYTKSVFVPPSGTLNANGVGLSGTGSVFLVTSGSTTGNGTNTGGGQTGGGTGGSTTGCVGAGCSSGGLTGGNANSNCNAGTNNTIVTQTQSGSPTTQKANLQCNVNGSRITWTQRR